MWIGCVINLTFSRARHCLTDGTVFEAVVQRTIKSLVDLMFSMFLCKWLVDYAVTFDSTANVIN